MRREDVATLLPIIKAWGEGKEIEVLLQQFPTTNYKWVNLETQSLNPYFNAGVDKYRIAPEKKKGWINIYKKSKNVDVSGGYIYQSKEAAVGAIRLDNPAGLIDVACIEIEYEEGQGL